MLNIIGKLHPRHWSMPDTLDAPQDEVVHQGELRKLDAAGEKHVPGFARVTSAMVYIGYQGHLGQTHGHLY